MLLLRLLLPLVHVCLLFGMLALSAVARSDAVLISFRPPQGAVAGYKVYSALQTTGPITNAPLDAGARAPDGSGLASYSLTGLDPAQSYSVEMTAYDSRGVESTHSNRLTVPARTETLGAALWSSDFQVYAPGVHVPGFVDSRGDSKTTTGTDLFSVSYFAGNDAAYGTAADSGMVSSVFFGRSSEIWGSYEISARVWRGVRSAQAGIAARVTGSGGDLRYFELAQNTFGTWLARARNEPALTCRNGTLTGVTQSANEWVALKFRVTRAAGLTRLRAKLWRPAAMEPAAWQIDCWTTLGAAADSGAFALQRYGNGSAYFDDIAVTRVEGTLDAIPPP